MATRTQRTPQAAPEVLAAIESLSEHINNHFATKGYVDTELAKITQELSKFRVEMVSRTDIQRIEGLISQIQLSIAGQMALKTDVMPRSEMDLRLKPIEATLVELKTSAAAMRTLADNRLWDVMKTVLPWVIMGIGVAVASAGHLQFH